MSEILRSLVTKFRGTAERRYAPRLRIRLPFSISTELNSTRQQLRFNGNTLDISANGLGLVFHSIRFDTYYLLKDGRPLNLMLEIPGGSIYMKIQPVRYERLGSENSSAHLIGARIVAMSEDHQQRYLAFLLPRVKTKALA